jgi:hypothetical protein
MTHQIMSLFGAAQNTYYPEIGAGATTYYGCNVTGEVSLGVGFRSVIRSILISNPTAGAPVVTIWSRAGARVAQWVGNTAIAQNILCGPEGFVVQDGFNVIVSAADGAYITIIYDQ